MSIPEISVVTPAYNAGNYLIDSITSVLNQSFPAWELIVVDDGSTDNTSEIATSFLLDKRITLIHQPNQGVSAARNAGIKAAKGKFIAFLDADDTFLPENLKIKYEAINATPETDYVYSDIMLCDAQLKDISVEKGISSDAINNAILTRQVETIPGFSSNIMIRSSAIKDKHLYFDTNLSNCADQYYKILLASRCKGAYVAQPLAKYRNTPDSMSKKIFLLEHDELYILDKIKEQNIIPAGRARRELFAKIYLMLSGSWYKDAGKWGKAIKFAFRALLVFPPISVKLLQKGRGLISGKRKQVNFSPYTP